MLNRRTVRHALADADLTLAQVCRAAGLPYYRVLRALNGYEKQLAPNEETRLRKALHLPTVKPAGPHELTEVSE